MLFLRDQSVPDLASLTSLPTEDRELVSAVMDGLSNFRNTLPPTTTCSTRERFAH